MGLVFQFEDLESGLHLETSSSSPTTSVVVVVFVSRVGSTGRERVRE